MNLGLDTLDDFLDPRDRDCFGVDEYDDDNEFFDVLLATKDDKPVHL